MIFARLRRLPRSIFTKLLLVILVAGICLNFTLGAFFHHAYRRLANSPLKRNLAQYAHLLVADMGIPPDPARARRLASEAGLLIWYHGPERVWANTRISLPAIEWEDRRTIWSERAAIRHVRHHGHFYLRYEIDAQRFTFRLAKPDFEAEDVVKGGLFILAALSITLGLVFIFVRRILKPVDHLTRGVHQVAAGRLDHRVPETGVDEFSQLARAFNQMTGRIKSSLEAREQLLLDVSHELRSPITRMRVALEFLPDSKARAALAEDVAAMDALVGQILEEARTHHEAGQLDLIPLDLAAAVKTAADGFSARRPGVVLNIPEGDWQVPADAAKVQTVLSNLLENAIKYSTTDSGAVRVELRHQAEGIEIRIRDEGVGIPPADLEHILEPFYRVDKSRTKATGGYGLGLSLCHTIMQAHRGRITISSQMGRGTEVTLLFPIDGALG
ncbi:MAG: HAMP domain-containing sensor histidine kinase [Desulfosarcinaceae bacterium]|nr:HAMP domain-containing sensor histidine kinase [Desulfosarcinaceae bacterium]